MLDYVLHDAELGRDLLRVDLVRDPRTVRAIKGRLQGMCRVLNRGGPQAERVWRELAS